MSEFPPTAWRWLHLPLTPHSPRPLWRTSPQKSGQAPHTLSTQHSSPAPTFTAYRNSWPSGALTASLRGSPDPTYRRNSFHGTLPAFEINPAATLNSSLASHFAPNTGHFDGQSPAPSSITVVATKTLSLLSPALAGSSKNGDGHRQLS